MGTWKWQWSLSLHYFVCIRKSAEAPGTDRAAQHRGKPALCKSLWIALRQTLCLNQALVSAPRGWDAAIMSMTEENKEIPGESAPGNGVWLIHTISEPWAEVLFLTQIPAAWLVCLILALLFLRAGSKSWCSHWLAASRRQRDLCDHPEMVSLLLQRVSQVAPGTAQDRVCSPQFSVKWVWVTKWG